ncbi:MAG: cytochrome C [Nitrosomonadales bacterium]|nr:MAG: cytochrome C [Nitrosomonadales bacterium]
MRHMMLVLSLLLPATLAQAQPPAPPQDTRQLVSMPDLPRSLMRSDMQDHLLALNEIIGHLAENKFDAAAETAEKRMGQSSMGKHAYIARGQGPGRFMPDTMRQMGWNMHDAATEFARVAKSGDQAKSLAALQQVTSSCAACHMSFRTR